MLKRFLNVWLSAVVFATLCLLISLAAMGVAIVRIGPPLEPWWEFVWFFLIQNAAWIGLLTILGLMWGKERVWVAIGQGMAVVLFYLFAHSQNGFVGLALPLLYIQKLATDWWPGLLVLFVGFPLFLKFIGELDRHAREPWENRVKPFNRLH